MECSACINARVLRGSIRLEGPDRDRDKKLSQAFTEISRYHSGMFSILFVAVFLASCLAMPIKEQYSYSPAVGLGSGTPFASSGEGHITAVRVWENNNAYISGFQLRYDYTWSPVFGREVGEKQEMELLDDEAIVQVSGKYNPGDYVNYLAFTTNRGRSLSAGQPSHISFNFYPAHVGSELRLLSGRSDGSGITSIGAHWGLMYMEEAGNSTVQ